MIFFTLKAILQTIVSVLILNYILVYFILKGTVVLHVDLNDPAINPDFCRILNQQSQYPDNAQEAFNVPFNLIVEGSYFGDNDCLF